MNTPTKVPKSDRLKGKRTLKVDHFFDDFEKDDLKGKVDIVVLFSYFGVELKQKGKGYIGLCPWHDDKNPSLSVDREKGLYNCFGCGESGDIFTLTEKMKGYEFKESLKFLKGFVGSTKLTASNVGHPSNVLAAKEKEQKELNAKQEIQTEKIESEKKVSQVKSSEDHADEESWEQLDLNRIADYYHKSFTKNSKAQEYLKDRGITNLSLWQRFNIGFADASIVSKAGERQKRELTKLGILRDSGKEHLQGCVTFPILDEHGQAVQFYGRASTVRQAHRIASLGNPSSDKMVTERSRSNHLYLKGKHKGVFNRKASKVYDEIILTESIFDALSLVQIGFENVQSIYGTNGFTEEHLEILRNDRVKTVIVALDSDEPGRKAALTLKEKLLNEGFAVKTVFPPNVLTKLDNRENSESNDPSANQELLGHSAEFYSEPAELLHDSRPKEEEEKAHNSQHASRLASGVEPKDWNDYLLYGISSGKSEAELKKEISQLIEQEETETKSRSDLSSSNSSGSDSSFEVSKEKLGTRFVFDDLSYLVSGVKEMFVSNLRVNIKAVLRQAQEPFDGDKYYDNLDLYSARSRKSFSQSMSTELGQEPKRVERDLIDILEYLEKERDRVLDEDKGEDVELSEAEKDLGLSFLRSENIVQEIQQDMEILGYVGEGRNKVIMYLIATSRLLNDPMSAIVMSQSASGKSMLMETVEEMMPSEDVVSISSLSDKALNYYKDLTHKFMTLGEAVHKEEIEYQLREIQSKRELTRLVTIKDPRTGEMDSKLIKTEVLVALALTTTSDKVNMENASRNFMLQADESVEQTARIHKQQRRKYSLERFSEKSSRIPEVLKKHHAAQRMLKNYLIINPFSEHIRFPENLMRTRRDHDRFLDLIAAVCFLRQVHKEVKEYHGKEYIECDLEDYTIAHDLMIHGILAASLTELPKGAVDLYDVMRNFCQEQSRKKKLEVQEVSFTQRDIREFTGFNHTWIKRQFKILTEYEYLEIVRGGGPRSKGIYRLRDDESISRMDTAMILSPDELKNILQEGSR